MKRLLLLFLALMLVLSMAVPVLGTETETTGETAGSAAEESTEVPAQTPAETEPDETVPASTEETEPARPEDECGPGMKWSFSQGTLTVDGSGVMDDFSQGAAPWEDHKNEIRTLVLRGGVETIGAYAFYDYDRLETVDLGSSLREVGAYAFANCDGLTNVHMPVTFKRFCQESFRSCANLKEFHFDGGMPSFNANCLWDTYAKLYYPTRNPWPLEHIRQLEGAFQGRIEFRAEDNFDPYTPETRESEETETRETAPQETELRETEPVVTTEPSTLPPEQTVPATRAPEEPEQTVPEFIQDPQQPPRENRTGKVGIILLAVVMILCAVGILYVAIRLLVSRRAEDEDEIDDLSRPQQLPKVRSDRRDLSGGGKKGGKYRR